MVSAFSVMLERYQGLKGAAGQAGELDHVLLWALLGCSWGHIRLSEYDAARAELGKAMELTEALDDRWGIAYSFQSLGDVEYGQGNYGAARELCAEALASARSATVMEPRGPSTAWET